MVLCNITLQGFQVSKSIIVPKRQKTRKRVLQYMHGSPSVDKLKLKLKMLHLKTAFEILPVVF